MNISRNQIELLEKEFGSANCFIERCFECRYNEDDLAKVSEILGGQVRFLEQETSNNQEYSWTDKFIFSVDLDRIRYFYIERHSSSWDGSEAYFDFVEVVPQSKTITVWKTL